MTSQPEIAARPDALAAVRVPDFRLLLSGEFLRGFAHAMLSVLIGWELFQRTGSAFALGLVGLVQIAPLILFSILGGTAADAFDRRKLLVAVEIGMALDIELSDTVG